ncbi:MAG: nucleotidyltransferase [Mesorhizobium sp.]|uniref:nucleotidyltransferase domain-containing protein n=1 Tax=unclassified Mesorhizobium TaxID=325217 RepID=UPI000F759954|nr:MULTISPECIES: nucleotidyltransferase [unclassified Mesorhizobium]RVC76365.1 nucleotidyltransferase [Mesorhizobium sp. M2A.F.Ca.ET.046.02.1.1]AZO33563.1 nucleotidyltransferase [Mesorhizobium sp. M2A.F.Ca.ET.046.03.2.1]RWB42777.1 MAG: nucleotidyltransferase [Mesorhizobium sp.]RWC57895.1 MAG: nucleotidyltransferase [Mesorhizobium sp.]RWE22005.1 MAG: nucleotidyltransferase [Mesorhizobium sp.]
MDAFTDSITPQAERHLEALAEELEIPPSRYEAAERSYKSFGDWLHRPTSTVLTYDPQVYVQGSFQLGTAIKPISEAEDYDVDSVCEFKALGKSSLSQRQLKAKLGSEVKAYARAQGMSKPVEEGRRCWKLQYADGAQFHMDIVPALPNGSSMRLLLEQRRLDTRWANTAIAITDNEHHSYELITEDWPRSNPKGYAQWFRTKVVEFKTRSLNEERARAEVEAMPTYKIKTPLQSAIMILKRHRDLMFADRYEERPISIIITTLAAHAYQGEDTIARALVSILTDLERHIRWDAQGNAVIANPTDPLENFADKWPLHPERKDAFFEWLTAARHDFFEAAKQFDRRKITDAVARGAGRAIAEKAGEKAFGVAAPTVLTSGLVGSAAQAKEKAVRLEGGGRNA